MNAWLEDVTGERHEFVGVCSIGRSKENQVVLRSKTVSRRHAVIFQEDAFHWLVDFGSSNGVFLNGKRLAAPSLVREGDQIQICEHRLLFRRSDKRNITAAEEFNTTAETTEHLNRVYAASGHGVLLLAKDGRILNATENVSAWFTTYFPGESIAADKLPARLSQWMNYTSEASPGCGCKVRDPLLIAQGDRRLVVRLSTPGPDQRILLFTEERPAYAIDMLETLGMTHRQAEVLHWLSEGKASSEIALILQCSVRTIEKHTEQIFIKLSVSNRARALLAVVEKLGPATA
jgi:pSer/pThr/pTyr-binding forkhead associated (FHA) protein/DNA-binding CsgD family transcriptional regulator